MGQCMSRKAAGAFAASAAVSHNRPSKMQKHSHLQSPDEENNKCSPTSDPPNKKPPAYTKGVAMSFGFRRRPATNPSIASNATAARRLANADLINRQGDRNGNDDNDACETDALTSHAAPTGRSTPRLAPPKKEAIAATRGSRFGFRQNQSNRMNKVADLNCSSDNTEIAFRNKVTAELGSRSGPKSTCNADKFGLNGNLRRPLHDNIPHANKIKSDAPPPTQMGKFTLQSTHLPRPEPIRLIETKTAKTLANNNRRTAGMYHQEETSSKDGSLTEDSGLGSHHSGYFADNDVLPEMDEEKGSPTFGARRSISQSKPRNLQLVVKSDNTFDVRDLNDSNDSIESCGPPPLPQLPSAFNSRTENKRSPYQSTGIVRERTMEYQRHLNWDNNRGRKISVTSSEGFSDEYGEEEKTFRDRFRSEKTFIKTVPHKTFLKNRMTLTKEADSSPPSSDEQEWVHGGEAMADDVSFSMSSSDESKDKKDSESDVERTEAAGAGPVSAAVIGTALQSLMSVPLSKAFVSSKEVKNVLLTIEDPKFAAVAAASLSGSLLDDELLSPVESLISGSESEELKKKMTRSSSNSKDVNEKATPTCEDSPPTPGTPTNASNSLSLSDGKDDFLIDDEIADQPALLFEETLTNDNNVSFSQNNSENTPTLVESTPRQKRRITNNVIEGSPLRTSRKNLANSRTGSLDTFGSCDSIASDDLMMDFDYSQSSGLEDCDRQNSTFLPYNDSALFKSDVEVLKVMKDWPQTTVSLERAAVCSASRSRLLANRSRTGTPTSVPDSPRSLDGRVRRLAASSPAKSRLQGGYDSDDSVRLDRVNHTGMKQDIMSIKTMLLKLRRILNESDTHNPFDSQSHLANGLFNSLCPTENVALNGEENMNEARLELADLRRQVLFLQGQLEDKEKTVQNLQEQMIKLATDNYQSNSAPASTVASDVQNTCNAATQTERIRPISAGPSLLNGSSIDGSAGSLVSVIESLPVGRPRPTPSPGPAKRTPSRLWRQPGEPPSPPRYSGATAIPRRARSGTRAPYSAATT